MSNNASQLSYRVIQVAGGGDTSHPSTLSLVPVNNVQSIINQAAQSTNAANGQQTSKYTYFPTANSTSSLNNQQAADLSSTSDGQVVDPQVGAGQFYVMMSSQDIPQPTPSRNIVSRKVESVRNSSSVSARDSNRRTQHNEVERRRRDKINNWIGKLSKLVPDCSGDNTKQGQSKGGILAKACDFIMELKQSNQHLQEAATKCETIQVDYEVLRLRLEEKKQENHILRQTLQSHGIEVAIRNTQSSSNSH